MSEFGDFRDFLPRPGAEEGIARAGRKLGGDTPIASEEAILDAIRQVYDPEIPVNLYDLGLIYRLEQNEAGDVEIDMTLTAPACPVAGTMPGKVAEAVAAVPGVGEVAVRLVWDPPWTRERMSEDARLVLGLDGP
jgi:FeS assembly SUF system protein